MVVTELAVLVTSTHARYHPQLEPLLSCSTLTLSSSPRSSISRTKRSVRPRSKRLRHFCRRWRLPESPLAPKMLMKTLASVPAPFTSPVMTMISYLTGTRPRTLLAKLSTVLKHSNRDLSIAVEEIPKPKVTFFKSLAVTLYRTSRSVTTTSKTCQKATFFAFFPSFVMWPMQIPAMSPTFFDENSNVSVAPLQPAVAGEPEGLVHGLVFHIDVLQVPTRSRAYIEITRKAVLDTFGWHRNRQLIHQPAALWRDTVMAELRERSGRGEEGEEHTKCSMVPAVKDFFPSGRSSHSRSVSTSLGPTLAVLPASRSVPVDKRSHRNMYTSSVSKSSTSTWSRYQSAPTMELS
ncbi:hypothetical protein EYF80_030639 [Liparis tanakae]|uniref:Uncharacterized protein n=1 Tax=Liparis tanakae TaxID=230148 RepID=A0A4Z2H192_9TELE|nr:hypothetical protein EYF80_030639 [Liparis tanakae]